MDGNERAALVDELADIEHQRWSDWQSWCHKVLRENCPSPEMEAVLERWDRQIATPYAELAEQEKQSDREQVERYMPIIDRLLAERTPEQISVEYACGGQDFWDLEPDGSLRIDIPRDQVVVSSDQIADRTPVDGGVEYVTCPDFRGSGIDSGPDPACSLCGTGGTIPAHVANKRTPVDGDAVERAAKAMFEFDRTCMKASVEWDDLPGTLARNGVSGRQHYREMARAALAADGDVFTVAALDWPPPEMKDAPLIRYIYKIVKRAWPGATPEDCWVWIGAVRYWDAEHSERTPVDGDAAGNIVLTVAQFNCVVRTERERGRQETDAAQPADSIDATTINIVRVHVLADIDAKGMTMSDNRIHKAIGDAYAKFDSDPRVGGPDNFEAFADAVEAYCEEAARLAESDFDEGFDLGYHTGVGYAYETSWHKAEALAEELRNRSKNGGHR